MNKQLSRRGWLIVSAIIAFAVVWLLFMQLNFLQKSGEINFSVHSFAVDSKGDLYVGLTNQIQVYSGDELVRTLDPKTIRSYRFLIDEEDLIYLSTYEKVTMDTNGNILKVWSDDTSGQFPSISSNVKKCVGPNGDVYELRSPLGWTCIVKNGTDTVFRISTLSYLCKVLLVMAVLAFVGGFAFCVGYAVKKKIA